MSAPQESGVPFSFFCSLVREISKIQPTSVSKQKTKRYSLYLEYPALNVFNNWITRLRRDFSPLPPGTTAIWFRLLFPEEDTRRKYDIKEPRMTKLLGDCFGIDEKKFQDWSLEESSGCLGQEIKVVLSRSSSYSDDYISPVSIADIDVLLDELASKSHYSDKEIVQKFASRRKRTRSEVIRSLFRPLSPEDASVLTQIILKDLKPLLYPQTEFHYSTALTKFNQACVKILTKEHAMDAWDQTKLFSRFYKMRSCLEAAANFADHPTKSTHNIVPAINYQIAVPKSEKGTSSDHALGFFKGSNIVWAENKYDGERAQIHVEILGDNSSRIKIFSKSKRDSTEDRHAVHQIIRNALGLNTANCRRDNDKIQVTHNVILDAEMVAFKGEKVEEYWRIRRLIEDTALGVRARRRSRKDVQYEHESMNGEDNEEFSLGLVFFDVMYLNSVSLLPQPYGTRRHTLENLIHQELGKAILATRYPIDMTTRDSEATLQAIFIHRISCHQEGLILKAEDSRYNDYKKPWVKLKKDYIENAGDEVQMVILGASWEKARGRILRGELIQGYWKILSRYSSSNQVPPSTFTTFYIGGLKNPSEQDTRPHFHIYFTVSYGLNRKELEELNFLVKNSNPIRYPSSSKNKVPYELTVFKGLEAPPTIIFETPLLAEIIGASFTKAAHSEHYEPRFPRLKKFYRPSERSWKKAMSLEKIHEVACISVGRDKANKDIDDSVGVMFGKPISPSISSPRKRKAVAEELNEKLNKLAGTTYAGKVPLCDGSPVGKCPRQDAPAHGTVVRNPSTPCPLPLTQKTNLPVLGSPINLRTHVPGKPKPVLALMLAAGPPTPSSQTSGSPRVKIRSKTVRSKPMEESSLAWFPSSDGKRCESCRSWKNQFEHHQTVGSIAALVLGCGWTTPTEKEDDWVKQGMIVIDQCNQDGEKWKANILEYVENLPCRTRRNEIIVFGCKSRTEPLFRVM